MSSLTLPFVSILIPTYGRIVWLEEALYCALHQAYAGNLEILICNDCSRQDLNFGHRLVKIMNVAACRTLGEKRNRMIEAASGDYIAWLDDDDLILPWYVDRLLRPMSDSAVRAVVSGNSYYFVDDT